MSVYELAQLQIVEANAPPESPTMTDFVVNLSFLNSIAAQSPDFVRRRTELLIAPGLIARKQLVFLDNCLAN